MNVWKIQRRLIRAGHTLLNMWELKIEKHIGEKFPFHIYVRPLMKYIAKNYSKASDLVGVEIGVDRGDNAMYILSTLDIKKLFLVDPYLEYDGFKDNIGWDKKTQNDFEKYFKIANLKLQPYKDRIEFIRKKSDAAADRIPDELDFVYIDGNHDYQYVKIDSETYYPKLKHGGILGGDNYETLFPGVMRAVRELADKHNLEIHGARWAESYEWWVVKP